MGFLDLGVWPQITHASMSDVHFPDATTADLNFSLCEVAHSNLDDVPSFLAHCADYSVSVLRGHL